MLEITVIMNSSVEEVLSFKCCNLHDQNLEIHLKNNGQEILTVPNTFELVNDEERYLINYLFPPGEYRLLPGEAQACYCYLDEDLFKKYKWIVFQDIQGKEYQTSLI